MTGVWIEANLPMFSRLAGRREVQRWSVVLTGVFLAAGAAAMASRWKVTAYWTAPFWQERLGPGVDLSLPPYERSVWPHAMAMTAVVALTLAIMVPLLRAGLFTVSVLVGAAATVLLTVLARWLARPTAPGEPGRSPLVGVTALVCLAAPLLGLAMIPGATVDPGHEPGLSFHMVTGWGLLAGGLLAAGLLGAAARPSAGALARLVLAGVVPAAMWWAYHRDGGWPGVPGWDYGMQSPLFLTVQITGVLIGAAAIGWALAATGLGARLNPPRPVDGPATDAKPREAQTQVG